MVSAAPELRVPAAPARASPSRVQQFAPLALGLLAIGALVYFDLGPPVAFTDDWIYAWVARRLAQGHGFHVYPEQAPLALVQTVWGLAFSLGHPDQRLLRLSGVPFVLLASAGAFLIARRLGADRFWSGVAAAALLGAPVFMGVATSFMTEAFYLGLLMAAAASAVRWLRTGRGMAACVVLTALATLERQHGAGLAVALAVALLVGRGERSVRREEWIWLAGMLAVAAAAVAVPGRLGLSTPAEAARLHAFLRLDTTLTWRAFAFLPGMVGLVLVPFGVALLLARRGRGGWNRRSKAASWSLALLGVVGLADMTFLLLHGHSVYPGNEWSRLGLNPPTVYGRKPELYPAAYFLPLEAAAVATFAVATLWSRRAWRSLRLGAAGIFLLALSVTQFVPMLETGGLERYYVVVMAPLVPVVAALAASAGLGSAAGWGALAARWWALAALAAGLAAYVAGEQDYQAWQAARDQAARIAYRSFAAGDVAAGYEAFAVYAQLPGYELTGRLARPLSGDDLVPTLIGPLRPRARLEFAGPGDPRPGVDYSSLAPGRIVIIPQ